MNSIESEESPVHATQIRAALVLDLFDLYYERVFAFLRKSTTPDAAEDLAQETFVRLLQHPDLESLTLSISYLLKIAHNLLRRRYARASRLRELLEERAHNEPELSGGVAKASKYAAGDLGSHSAGEVLETALGLLSRDEEDAIRLIVCEGKSYQHAAQSLGVSVSTINNWKHRGIIKLRNLVGGDTAVAQRFEANQMPKGTPAGRPMSGRHGRTESEQVASEPSSPAFASRSLMAWRPQRDEVA